VFSWRWSWTHSDEPAGNITVASRETAIELRYRWTPSWGDPQQKSYTVPLDRTPCRYGGSRPWFRCPWCCRRVAVVYGLSGDGYFGCRHCLRLAYMSEAESTLERLWRRQRKLEARIGEDYERPKGMRTRTYDRIIGQINDIEERKDYDFFLRCGPLLRRLGMPSSAWISG
jgi:hypothetical protein